MGESQDKKEKISESNIKDKSDKPVKPESETVENDEAKKEQTKYGTGERKEDILPKMKDDDRETSKKKEEETKNEKDGKKPKGFWEKIKKLLSNPEQYNRKYIYSDKEVFQRTVKYVLPYKKEIWFLIFLLMVTSITNMAYPIGMKFVLDEIQAEHFNGLYLIVFLLLIAMIVNFFSKRHYQYRINMLGQKAMTDIRYDIFTHLQKLSLKYYTERPAGKIMSTLTNDVGTVNALISNSLIQLIGDLFTVITTFVLLLIMSWKLTLIIILLAPIFALIFIQFAKRSRLYWIRARRTIANITGILQESISGSKTIKAFATEDINIQVFDKANREDLDVNWKAAKLNAFLQPVTQLITAIAVIIVIYIGAHLLKTNQLQPSELLAYILLAMNFLGPFNNIGNFYNNAQAAMAGGERILLILDEKVDVKDKEGAIDLPKIEGYINYENVSFSYIEGIEVLKDINIKVKPKQRVAFVGFTGAGKTTLISLLSRFYDPTKGRITIDGHDIRDIKLESLKKHLGIVLQDTFLFSGTIKDNIKYGRLDATDEEIIEAAKSVGAHKFIMKLPNGYETDVMERGQLLSIGQRQLISFARALLADPPILILDEATSSVDPYTELKIQEALEVLLKGRNSFIIAHRLSTILNSDMICAMEHGRVIQAGTHDELMKQEGLYKHLYEMQFKKPEDKSTLTKTS